MSSVPKAIISNFYAGILSFFLRPQRAMHYLVATPLQLVLLIFIWLALNFGFDLYRIGTEGKFNIWAAQSWLASISLTLFAAWVCSILFRRTELLLELATVSISISFVLFLYALLLQEIQLVFELPEQKSSTWLWWLQWAGWWLPIIWYAVALATTAIIWANKSWHWWPAAISPWVITLFLTLSLGMAGQRLWIEDYALGDEQGYIPRELSQEQVEKLIYNQPTILKKALTNIAKGVDGQPELFFLAIAGYGEQDVFMREVLAVNHLIQGKFNSEKRSLVLVNNAKTIDQYPIATVTSVKQSLSLLAEKMNVDEDVLMVFMTSHGSKAEEKKPHQFSISLDPLVLQQITPSILKTALEAAGIKHRVIIVSACYSGGFIPELQTPDSLLISASHAERNSFWLC